jgi:hypothetical protein
MFNNQITATTNQLSDLNYKLDLAQSLNGSKKLICGLLREIQVQTRCLDYLIAQTPLFVSPVEVKYENINLNLIFA